jgi:hypothetical protein
MAKIVQLTTEQRIFVVKTYLETLCDFFLRGYLQNKVYTSPPLELNDLRNRTRDEVHAKKYRYDLMELSK